MTGMPWVKVWTDMLDDPKLAEVEDVHKWRFVQLILLAGQCDNGGRLVDGDTLLSDRYIARRLGISTNELHEALTALEANRLVSRHDGAVCVVAFAKRQGRSQTELRESWRERQQRYRASSHASVTRDSHVTSRDVTPPEAETETETETETEGDGATAPARPPTVPPDLRNQPRPPTQKQKARAELERQTNTAILAWRNVFKDAKRQLNPVQVAQIIRVVTDPVKWGTVCTEWALRGFSETNVEGLLDVYVNGWRNPGSNGKSDPGARKGGRSGTFRRAQVPDSTPEQREASRVAAAYNIKQREYCKAHGLDPRKDVIDRAKVEAWTPGGNHER